MPLGPETSPGLDVDTALMVPTVSAALVDGVIEDREIAQIMALCLQNPRFENNSEDDDTEIIMAAVGVVQKEGQQAACRLAAAVLPPSLCETAFAFAVAIIGSDGRVEPSESRLMDNLVLWLNLDPGRARAIVSVIPILQNDGKT